MVKAVVGANWGDEGKGKITDMLAEKADIIVRFQGGANAGHTIVNNYGKFALHTLPSGVFYNHTTSVIGNGVALNIPILMKEIKSITDRNVPMPKILVSDRAQMVMPYHILFDQYEEDPAALCDVLLGITDTVTVFDDLAAFGNIKNSHLMSCGDLLSGGNGLLTVTYRDCDLLTGRNRI